MAKEKILTRDEVIKLGLDKASTITADMLDGYTIIGNFAFNYCFNLISITIPNNITYIGEYVFAHCSGLTSVTIPNSVTSINECAFSYCTHLSSVTISNSVTLIGYGVFNECNCLTSIVIGNVEYKKHEIINGKCKAYKAFNANMISVIFSMKKVKLTSLKVNQNCVNVDFTLA